MDGILPLWKEKGMTSHDCVFKLRKILQTKKVGHTGTLDPNVEGVLPICIGKATKLAEYLTDTGKEYTGEITMGVATTTEDADGEEVAVKAVEIPIDDEIIDVTMQRFLGCITQIPPMYSAVKVNGKRLYEYARQGETVARPRRKVYIQKFKRTSPTIWQAEYKRQTWQFDVACGKGTYVRTLAVDLGEALGYPAHMSNLIRTKSGGFSREETFTLAQIAEKKDNNQMAECLYPLERGVASFPRLNLSAELYQKVKNGSVLPKTLFQEVGEEKQIVALFHQEQLVSLYGPHPSKDKLMKPIKVIQNDLREADV